LDKQGLVLKPGPSLEIRLLGTRIDSETPLPGFYRLITPKQILNFGTVKSFDFIGTPKKIASIEFGDILFGESGTGRTMVYLDNDTNTINNAHAHILRPIPIECSLEKAITIRSIMQYYKEIGITDCMTVGGAGGHLSPSYFDRVFIPNFPSEKQSEIAKLYYNPDLKYMTNTCTLNNFLQTDINFNSMAGIYELDKTANILKERLDYTIDNIINDIEVEISFSFDEIPNK
jgi:type I restriction enzyme S subunit